MNTLFIAASTSKMSMTSITLHGATIQKTAIFIIITVLHYRKYFKNETIKFLLYINNYVWPEKYNSHNNY
jgi:hypothetical protein